MSRTTLHLSKQNFKFSAAHFLIFDDKNAERLHGHNYQVEIDIEFVKPIANQEQGYFVDFNVFKSGIVSALKTWDEMVLLPKLQRDMKFEEEGPSLKVWFRERFYVFPKNEVLLLPVTNTSTEQFSKLLAERFFDEFKSYDVKSVRVYVEETRGQGASTLVQV